MEHESSQDICFEQVSWKKKQNYKGSVLCIGVELYTLKNQCYWKMHGVTILYKQTEVVPLECGTINESNPNPFLRAFWLSPGTCIEPFRLTGTERRAIMALTMHVTSPDETPLST